MTTPTTERRTDAPGLGRRRPSPFTVLGVALLAAGLACLGWLGYQLVGTDLVAEHTYEHETRQLRDGWAAGPPGGHAPSPRSPGSTRTDGTRVPGTAIALLRVPRFGAGYEVPVVTGTDASDLARGVGHYDGTAEPGAVGNFAVAGHRITHGEPFSRLLDLDKGDRVVVETREAVFTYVMDTAPRDLTVDASAGWVLDPVPQHPEQTADRALITLTTCQDLFHSPDRSVGFGHLESARAK